MDNVKFLGQRNDVNELYQAFDIFLLPSLYEGLGMVAIEAQVSGLPCMCSSEVPKVAKVTKNLDFLDLNINPEIWAACILKKLKNHNRKSYVADIRKNGYDIKHEAKILEEKYLEIK